MELEYSGGDHGSHYQLWEKQYPGREIPEHKNTCRDCGEVIEKNCFLKTKEGSFEIVGDCCVAKYVGKPKTQLTEIIPSNEDNRYSPKIQEEIFKSGKYEGYSFAEVFDKNRGYMRYISKKPVEEPSLRRAVSYYLERQSKVPQIFKEGKYQGESFSSVLEKNPDYFLWLLQNQAYNPKYVDAFHFYESNSQRTPPPPRDSEAFTFGKHLGKTIPEVWEEDPNYLFFVIRNFELQDPITARVLTFYKDKIPPGDGKFSSDKFKGLTFAEVLEKDPEYFTWIRNGYRGKVDRNGNDYARAWIWFLSK